MPTPKNRYISRQSHGIVICNGPQETYIHEDGVSHGTGAQLDAGALANQKLEELDKLLISPDSPETRKRIEFLNAEVSLLAAEHDLSWDPYVK